METLSDPLLGALLDGRYQVQSRVARGGMATVYAAVDTRLDRRVAVKVMHPALADDEAFLARFGREAKAAARLSHPNVVPVYDQGTDAGSVFLVMEYVAGRTLRDLLRERGRLSPEHALAVLDPVLAALEAAHSAGLVHRDVKPENVLLADDGRVKVADFGLARAVEAANLTATTGLLIGTVAYLAPEQVARGSSDARSDVYAAGILLYELLVGSPPYTAETPLAVAYRHVHDDVPPPSAVEPGVPAVVDTLVRQATRRDPGARFASARAFRAALAQARAGLPAHHLTGVHDTMVVRSVGWPADAVAVPPRRHHVGRWLTGVAVLLLVLAAIGAGWWFAVGRYTTVPVLLKADRSTALARLHQAGLRPRFGPEVFSASIPVGRVAVEAPEPGQQLLRGDTVTLVLSKGPEVYAVPRLAGTDVETATGKLKAVHLRAVKGSAEYSSVPAGSVVRTSPAAGTRLRPGSGVTLVVSRGPRPVAVPPVAGKDVPTATGLLQTAGFVVGRSDAYSDTVPKDVVIGTDRRTAVPGTTVTLLISKGPQLFAVPDVRELAVGRARAVLVAAGFRVEVVAAPFGPGRVLAQSPPGKSLAAHGTTVTLSVF